MSQQRSRYIGAILAGGKGTRMAPLPDRLPKPLLPVANKPLIQYQIELLRDLGITDILLLIGHKGFEISRVFGDGSALGVRIRYVEQTQTLGIAHAVGRFEPHVDRPMMLFLGDIFFLPADLKEMLARFEAQGGGAVLAAKEEPSLAAIQKNFSMVLDDAGRVRRVIEKPRHPPNHLKGVGLYLFDVTVFDAIRRTPRTAMRDEYEITESIQVMIDDGHPVSPAKCILDDINVTNPRDLLHCNLMQARQSPTGSVIGERFEAADGARIDRCVIGRHVTVRHPITLRNCLVFDDTLVECTTDLENAIVLPDSIIDCRHDTSLVRENRE